MKQLLLFIFITIAFLHFLSGTNYVQAQISNHIVISEVYGGGGNTGAYWKQDFIELYNPTSSAVDLTGWSVQYGSATGTTWTNKTDLLGTIAAHGFYLVQEAQGTGGTAGLPTPDLTGTIAMSATNGKVALVNSTTFLIGANPSADPSVVDFVGYGTANGYETVATPALTNTTSDERKAQSTSTIVTMANGGLDSLQGNGWDSNNNSSDFITKLMPQPQNSSFPLETPPNAGNAPPSISGITRVTFIPLTSEKDSVKAIITDDGVVTGAKLHIRVNGGNYDSSLTMVVLGGTTYGVEIPASKHVANGDLVEYFLSATDDSSKYSSTETSLQGYFVGDAPISSIKAQTLTVVNGYGARVNGTLNVKTNLFSSGSGYIQDATGGMRIFMTGMVTIDAGRNAKVEGTINARYNAFQLTTPNFSFVDTTTGTSTITPATITLPITQSASNVNEGRVVKVISMSTDSTGTFGAAKTYPYREPDNTDTVLVYIESNGTANTIVGKTIPSTPVDVVGVLAYFNTFMEIKPRGATDLGLSAADGSGTATIKPTSRLISLTAVAETLTVTGDGTNTLEGVSIQVPLTWTWSNTSSAIFLGAFAGKTPVITGDGTTTPYVITINGLSLTNVNPGTIEIYNLNTPSTSGLTTFITKTQETGGTLTSIIFSPTVNITSNTFEAITSGNWNSSSLWSGGVVPGPSDNVTFTTKNVVVTITADAQCNNLTMTGIDTTGSAVGPVLQFAASTPINLTVNGRLDLSGTVGRPQLTSNANVDATLIAKGYIFTNVSNTTANGNRGLNMNEGTVRFIGATSDSLKTGAGFRLANLQIGDGVQAKTLTWVQTSSATMNVRSLIIKNGSSLILGGTTLAQANSIGNFSTSEVPMLTGGVTIENSASLIVNNASSPILQSPSINIKSGGLINNGTLNLKSLDGSRKYNVTFGGLSADTTAVKQTVGGSASGIFANVTVGRTDTQLDTLLITRSMQVDTMSVWDDIVESAGNGVVGMVRTIRPVAQGVNNTFGGIGLEINAADAAPETTSVVRITGTTQTGNGKQSIKRSFDISPKTNAALNATFLFRYDDSELNGQNANTLQLFQSEDNGTTWIEKSGVVNTTAKTITLPGVNSFSRWTAADANNNIGGALSFAVLNGWNMVSVPVTAPDYRKTVLFPTALTNAFAFQSGYQSKDTLQNGVGYWLKFGSNQNISIPGAFRLSDSVDVSAGWNMIGSVSVPCPVANVVAADGASICSPVYGYYNGYIIVTTLVPGQAYWVKSCGAGKLRFNP
jgi:hypothetical protein